MDQIKLPDDVPRLKQNWLTSVVEFINMFSQGWQITVLTGVNIVSLSLATLALLVKHVQQHLITPIIVCLYYVTFMGRVGKAGWGIVDCSSITFNFVYLPVDLVCKLYLLCNYSLISCILSCNWHTISVGWFLFTSVQCFERKQQCITHTLRFASFQRFSCSDRCVM